MRQRKVSGAARLCALASLFVASAAAAAPAEVSYRLSPVMEGAALKALSVEVRFRADPDGVTRLRFRERWQGEPRLGQFAEGLQVEGASRIAPDGDGGAEIVSAPGALLTARYRVRSAYAAAPTVIDGRQTRPIVLPDWFYAAGEVLFAYPEGRSEAPARFDWTGAPGWRFASDLEHLAGPRRAARRAGVVSDVVESIVVGSPRLQLAEGRGEDAGVRVAAVGGFERFGFDAFADLAFRTVRAERRFWGERGQPFLVTLAPLAVGAGGGQAYSGSGRADAFALWVGADFDLPELRTLLAHEYFHTWNPGDLGGMDDNHVSWLSEGFTDFYARRLLLRAGVFDLQDFAASWNELLLAYAVSSARNLGQAETTKRYWTDEAASDVTYKRGAMLAVLLDDKARRATGGRRGLDEVMRRVRELAAEPQAGVIDALFLRAYREVTGVSAEPEVGRYELQGETLWLPAGAFACLDLQTVTQPAWDVGFDLEATARTGVFSGVDPEGPAYAAGLRDGMRRLGREGGAMNDSGVEIAYRVADASGAERTVRYKPEGRSTVTFQRLAAPAMTPAGQADACRTALAGADPPQTRTIAESSRP